MNDCQVLSAHEGVKSRRNFEAATFDIKKYKRVGRQEFVWSHATLEEFNKGV